MIPPRNERKYLLMQLDEAAHMSQSFACAGGRPEIRMKLDVPLSLRCADGNGSKGPPQLRAAGDGIARLHGIQAGLGKIHGRFRKAARASMSISRSPNRALSAARSEANEGCRHLMRS